MSHTKEQNRVHYGELILHKPPSMLSRVDFMQKASGYGTLLIFMISVAAAITIVMIGKIEVGISLLVFALGMLGYLYSMILNRQQQVTQIAEKALVLMQERWDALREDGELLDVLTSNPTHDKLDPRTALKLRLYLASFLDALSLMIHYIRRGYFRRPREFAAIYENIIESFFQYHPIFIDIWEGTLGGFGNMRGEYGKDVVYVVDNLILRIKDDQSQAKNITHIHKSKKTIKKL